MKYLPLIWQGIWRRPGRAWLLLLQIVSAFALFGVLQGVSSGTKQAIAATHSNRLYIASKISVSDPLPIAMLERIRSIPGIRDATPRAVIIGTYQTPQQGMPVLAVDAEPFFRIFDELSVSPEAVTTLKNTHTGAIIGSELARRHGWKIGDRFVLQSSVIQRDGSPDWSFDVVGVFDAKPTFGTPPPTAVIANFDYVNGARSSDIDQTNMFMAVVRDVAEAGVVSLAIDDAFANSANETHTQSEGDLVSTNIQKTVDLDFIVRSVVAAVFFALLLATGALMMQSLRERTSELAVLKAVGFSDRRILMLLLTESIVFCVVSAAIGLAMAAALLPQARSLVGIASMPPIVITAGFMCALVLGLMTGAAPAMRASRLRVVDALAGR
ncbi:MAG TPA: ABC transporter permease [Steroidobacteraceae bacterium]|nr:ABC transporter permease [Steroidobacteraceae bacterium]